jgi:hypothetical protein
MIRRSYIGWRLSPGCGKQRLSHPIASISHSIVPSPATALKSQREKAIKTNNNNCNRRGWRNPRSTRLNGILRREQPRSATNALLINHAGQQKTPPERGFRFTAARRPTYMSMPPIPPIPPMPPPMPPMPPPGSSFGSSATRASVVSINPATEAACCKA